MDRYERIIHDVLTRTGREQLRWVVVNPTRHANILLNPHLVIRAFRAEYPVGNKVYELLFVERRIEQVDVLGDTSERSDFDLHILDGDDTQIVLSLYEGVVDRDDLLRLSGLIEAFNDRARSFFDAFDAINPSEVA